MTEAKKSGKRPPKREEIGSRISYKDRKKLSVTGRDDNYVYRVVNSDDARYANRVDEMTARGYSVCTEESLGDSVGIEGSSVGSAVGKPVGNGVQGVLMRIPKKFYEEDQRQKQAEVDESEKGMLPDELLNSENATGSGLKIDRPSANVQQK